MRTLTYDRVFHLLINYGLFLLGVISWKMNQSFIKVGMATNEPRCLNQHHPTALLMNLTNRSARRCNR